MIIISMQYFGGNGASSGKSGGGKSGGGAEAKVEKKPEKKPEDTVSSLRADLKNSKQTEVKLTDKYGDPTGEVDKGYVGKDGTTLVNIHQEGSGYVLDVGDTTRGFVAAVRPGGKPMSELEALKRLKSYL